MITWTTPTIPILVKGGNILSTNCKVLFTFKQGEYELTLEPDSMTATEDGVLCEVSVTQLESGGFSPGAAKVQVNVVDSNNLRAASAFKRDYLGSNLIEREVRYDSL
jgi:hypothetical protein